ncbi:putative Ig domain-containing protein [Gloeothece verrucosa]|uniref:C-type lectin domain protein n=1 Tax=Gloeothece verrucosa (strain PCC 7822) TaxID=497965 RepID=E0UD28_GLOV7|nr:putative Ig domain-containing protein [Gloeothece verrucosa]ADN12908.1 C-type lectin domain protein [Gloeothece verrucosa PCC 7822]
MNTQNTPLTIVVQALELTFEQLGQLAGNDLLFRNTIATAFGESADASAFQTAWANGDFSSFPPIEIRSRSELSGANGAFAIATGKIYLAQEFIEANINNPDAIAHLLIQQFGYYLNSLADQGNEQNHNNNLLLLLALAGNRRGTNDTVGFYQGNRHLFQKLSNDNRDTDFNALLLAAANGKELGNHLEFFPSNQIDRVIDVNQALIDNGVIDVPATVVEENSANQGDGGTRDTVISRTIAEVSKNPETKLDETKLKDNLTVIFAESLQNNSKLDLLEIYEVVDTALRDAYSYLSKFRFDPEYTQKLETAFGTDFNREVANKLFNNFADGNFTDIPTVKIVNRADIYGVNGAFSADTGLIYLTREFLNENYKNTSRITDVLLEEAGHFVDSQINKIDSPGDEGEIFANLVQGNTLTEQELQILKAENDIATVISNGQGITVIPGQSNITIEENAQDLRVATWNIWDGRGNGQRAGIQNILQRINYIARYSDYAGIDLITLQEIPDSDQQPLARALYAYQNNQPLPNQYTQQGLQQMLNGYSFIVVPSENNPRTPNVPNSDGELNTNSSDGYLILYDPNTITINSSGFFRPNDFYASLNSGNNNFTNYYLRPPYEVNITHSNSNQQYRILTWHNEYEGGALAQNARIAGFDDLVHSLRNTNNPNNNTPTLVLGDFNVRLNENINIPISQTQTVTASVTDWLAGNINGLDSPYRGVHHTNYDYIIANGNIQVNYLGQDRTDSPLLLSDSHQALFAQISNNGINNNATIIVGNAAVANLLMGPAGIPRNNTTYEYDTTTISNTWIDQTIKIGKNGSFFTPLTTVDGGRVTVREQTVNGQTKKYIDVTANSSNVNAKVYSAIGNNQSAALFNGDVAFDTNTLTGTITDRGDSNDSSAFKLIGGIEVSFDGLSFGEDADGNPQLRLQGSMLLPQNLVGGNGLLVAINGSDYIGISDNGLEVTGGFVQLPGTTSFVVLGLLEIQALNAQVKFDFTNEEITLQGQFKIPSLKNAAFNLQGGNYIKIKKTATGLDFSMVANVTTSNIPLFGSWEIQDINLNVNTPNNNFTVNAKLKTPGSPINLTLAFTNGQLTQITGSSNGVGTDFTFLGAAVDIDAVTTRIDRDTADSEPWDPEFSLQGSIEIPKLKGLKGTLDGTNKLVVNNSGVKLTGAYLELAKIKTGKTVDQALAEGIKLGAWTLYDIAATYGDVTTNGVTQKKFTGNAKLRTSEGEDIGLNLEFNESGLQNITANNVNFNLFGATVNNATINFTPDRTPNVGNDWDPEFKLQGTLKLPQALGGVELSVTGSDYLLVNNNGFNLTGGDISKPTLNFNLLGFLRVNGSDIHIKYTNIKSEKVFIIQGKVTLPDLYNLTGDFSGSDKYIKITSSGQAEVVGSISVDKSIDIAAGWKIKSATVSIDTSNNQTRVTANATVEIPSGIDVAATVNWNGSQLESIAVGVSDLNKPIGGTGAYLQSLNGSYNASTTIFTGAAFITAGPRINIDFPDVLNIPDVNNQALVNLDLTTTITQDYLNATGKVNILGNLITGSGEININWQNNSFFAQANLNILYGLIEANATLIGRKYNSNFDFYALAEGSVKIPSAIPVIGGWTLGSGGVYVQFIDDNNSSNDYFAAWGQTLGISSAVKIGFDGSFSLTNSGISEVAKQKINNLKNNINGSYNRDLFNPPNIDNEVFGGNNDNNTLWGTDSSDLINGYGGNDILHGKGGDDNLNGGDGNDILNGGSGKNIFNGGTGDDTLIGRTDDDTYIFDTDDPQGSDTINETTIALRTAHNTYIRTDAGSAFFQNDHAGPWEEFQIITQDDGKIALQTFNNTYMRANSAWNVDQAGSIGDWEKFRVIDRGSGQIALEAHWPPDFWNGYRNTYIQATNTGLITQTNNLDSWETFTPEFRNNDIDTLDFSATTTKTISLNLGYYGQQQINENLFLTLNTYFGSNAYINIENAVGGSLNDTIRGNNLNNFLRGNGGNDSLYGGDGNDSLDGEDGNDFLDGGNGNDTLLGSLGNDTLLSASGDDYLYGGNGNDTLDGSDGGEGNDTLDGGDGNDYLDGGRDNDILRGASGNDYLYGGGGNDTLDGGEQNDTLLGASGDDYLYGGNGNDTLDGSDGGEGNDTLDGGDGNDYLDGGRDNDILRGASGNDYLYGGGGNDTLDGGDHDDTLIGSTGYDIVNYAGSHTEFQATILSDGSIQIQDMFTSNGNEGTDILREIEKIYFATGGGYYGVLTGGTGNDSLTANNNWSSLIFGDAGNDTLNGAGLGDDTLSGGTGNDLLNGQNGNDLLDGGAGVDTLIGGNGNDLYIVDTTTDIITENAAQGTDTIQSSVTFSLADLPNIENLTLTGTNTINGTGNTLNNTITGNNANNILDGGAGIDTLIGGLGDDLYIVDTIAEIITENAAQGTDTVQSSVSITLAANIENLTLTGTNTINATGNELNNTITGNNANNILDGGAGIDTLIGGLGDDLYIVDTIADLITENAAEGTDTVQSSVSITLAANIENLTLTGTNTINATGNELNNTITGNNANNILDGSDGDDTLIGGLGDDLYIVDTTTDIITENAAQGTDTIQSSVTFSLANLPNIENLTLTGINTINGTGNVLNNLITGNSANNILNGGAGNDTLIGGDGFDTATYTNLQSNIQLTDNGSNNFTAQFAINGQNYTHQLQSIEKFEGSQGNDNIRVVNPSANFSVDGGLGLDTLDYSLLTPGTVQVISTSPNSGTVTIGAITQFYQSIENIILPPSAPTLNNAIAPQTATEDTPFTFTIPDNTFIDANVDDVLSYSATLENGNPLPSWLTFDSASRTFSGTPTNSEVGAINIKVLVTDLSGAVAPHTFTLTVANTNDAPTLNNAIAPQTAIKNSPFTFTIPSNTFSDVDLGDSLSYSLAPNTILPSGVTFNVATRTFSGTPTSTSVGIYNITIIATDTAGATVSNTFTLTIANLIGTSGNDTLIGTPNSEKLEGLGGNDSLAGAEGNDTLDGGTGNDSMSGGTGDDLYIVNTTSDRTLENPNEGIDTVQSSVNWTLGTYLENLILTGSSNLSGTGNTLNNSITGNGGNNNLSGLDGNDFLIGGSGNDTLNGGAGNDTLVGGTGNEVYNVDSSTDVINENIDEGTDTVNASATYVLSDNLETLTLTGTGNIDGTGNRLNNILTGNSGNNLLTGDIGNDTLNGGTGNDTLDGGVGGDSMAGGSGNDVYAIDDINDVIIENLNAGIDVVNTSITYTLGNNLENLNLSGYYNTNQTGNNIDLLYNKINGTGNSLNNVITGNYADNILSGEAGNDSLTGFGGNDTLYGGAGNDTLDGSDSFRYYSMVLVGGTENDVYIIDSVNAVIVENSNEGTDLVITTTNYTLPANVDNLTLAEADFGQYNGTGNNLNNILTGNTNDNSLTGAGGNDTLDGGAGNDILIGDLTNLLEYNGHTYLLTTPGTWQQVQSQAQSLGGNLVTINSGAEQNWLVNNFTGYEPLWIGLTDELIEGEFKWSTGEILSDVDYQNWETNQPDNNFYGTPENYVLMNSSSPGKWSDNIPDFNYRGIVELTQVLGGNDSLIGGSGNDTLYGGAGNDTLNGGTDDDSLVGGSGNDVYIVDSINDVITENLNDGVDQVNASVSYTLSANLERLSLTGTSDINGTGNSFNNSIIGNAGNNTLTGAGGNDTVDGGAGNDLIVEDTGAYYYNGKTYILTDPGTWQQAQAQAQVLGGNLVAINTQQEQDWIVNTFGGTELLWIGLTDEASEGDFRWLTGEAYTYNNWWASFEPNNTYYNGEPENYVLINWEIPGGWNDIIPNRNHRGIVELDGSSSLIGNDSLNGGTGNDTLDAGAGNDTLNGGIGDDSLLGSAGNDIYIVDNINDVITENLNQGTDIVNSSVSFTLADNVENLTLTGTSNINGTGNSLNNTLTGNNGANILSGQSGNDSLNGGSGDDTLQGQQGNDTLTGGVGNDVLEGGESDDRLAGGAGSDLLTGGNGINTFVINPLTDSLLANFDRISDLKIGVDKIDGPTAVSAALLVELGEVTDLSAEAIASVLNPTNFLANRAATFTIGQAQATRTFVALNNNTAGFIASADAVIEITGYTGDLTNLAII